MNYEYVKLIDREHYGTVVRADGAKQYEWDDKKGWVRSGILILYFCDESEYYDLYEEITEDEAMKLIGAKEKVAA
ncbi:MAG: hypothetical protein LBT88_07390 [Oscillospiraceae bacterium]|jgi:hypothetical protein|nr:hypothetical protein [Oscillospiraceae bacterium]